MSPNTLVTGHFGSELHAKNTLEQWISTEGVIERALFLCKDAPGLVDDFKPSGSPREVQDMNRKADRVFRGTFNRHGRSRLGSDGRTVKADNYARGLVLSTGEDLPAGHSLQSRVLMLEWPTWAIDWSLVTRLQADRAAGHHAGLMAAFICWLAQDRPTRLDVMEAERLALLGRIQAASTRTAGIAADLLSVRPLMEGFARAHGLETPETLEAQRRRIEGAVRQVASDQAEHMAASDPAERFISLLRAALHSGRAHLEGARGEVPASWKALAGYNAHGDPSGERIGYLDPEKKEVWLIPEVAFAAAAKLGELGTSEQQLWKRLREKDWIRPDGPHHKPKRPIPPEGTWARVVVLKLPVFLQEEVAIPCGESGESGEDPDASRDHASPPSETSWEEVGKVGNDPCPPLPTFPTSENPDPSRAHAQNRAVA